jgi:DeoR family transcriptional regulator, fructose operon transcriptional repressor
MTIRRDLAELEHRGLVRRVRGGAATLRSRDVGYGLRERLNRPQKEAIGRRAAALVASGEKVFIDAGTTCLEVARFLAKRQLPRLYLVTTSLKVSAELGGIPEITLVQLGGEIYDQSCGVVGEPALKTLRTLRVDWAFLGASAFDVGMGPSNNNPIEVLVKRAAIKSAKRAVFLVDGSKLGQVALAQICPIDEAHTLITTAKFSGGDERRLRSLGWEVIEAS